MRKTMKKMLICSLCIFMILAFCSCSQIEEKKVRTYTETQDNLQITYTCSYDDIIVSKNIYDTNTGITTEYFYFYEDRGWGEHLIGTTVITIDKDGQIIDKYEK